MSHETETGAWPERINADHGSSVSSSIQTHLNKPLPWVALAFIITIAVSVFCVYRVAQAENEADRAKQTAFDAQTQCLLVSDHVRDLREDMAAHGVIPLPTYPKRLK